MSAMSSKGLLWHHASRNTASNKVCAVQYLDDSIQIGEAAQVLILHVAQAAVLGGHQLVVCQLLQDALLHLWMLTDQVPKYNM